MSIARNNILIVDDDNLVRRILSRQLKKEGYSCIEAEDAVEAIKKLQSNSIDLVILDIMMSGKSGRELLPQIKADFPDVAVIMSTAVTDIDVVIECMREGAQDYLIKPFDLDNITRRVEGVLHKRHIEQEIKRYQQQLKTSLTEQTREVRKIFIGAIESLVTALEASDKYTAGHSHRVKNIALALGEKIHLTSEELENLCWGALLHDVGKIALDPHVRNKPGKLTEEEYAHVMDHINIGPEIVKSVVNDKIVQMIKYHHYRYDGRGFEQKLTGDEIPLSARILAVADTFDAMTSNRPYRAALSLDTAIAEIKKNSGTQFDPTIVQAFLSLNLQPNRPASE